MSDEGSLNVDFTDLLEALSEARADFVVVGAHALAVHGITRATVTSTSSCAHQRPTRSESSRRFAPSGRRSSNTV